MDIDIQPEPGVPAGLSRLQSRQTIEELFGQCHSIVRGVAARTIGDHDAAQDVAQSVLIHLWQHPDGYDPGRGPLKPWLSRVAHNRSVDWIRAETSRRAREEDVEPRADPPGPEEIVEGSVTADQVQAALAALPQREEACIRLAFFSDLTYRQVAEVLGRPEGTVKAQIRSGLRRLAKNLDPTGGPVGAACRA